MGHVAEFTVPLNGRHIRAKVEVFSSEPQIEEGFVLDIIKIEPAIMPNEKQKLYDLLHNEVSRAERDYNAPIDVDPAVIGEVF